MPIGHLACRPEFSLDAVGAPDFRSEPSEWVPRPLRAHGLVMSQRWSFTTEYKLKVAHGVIDPVVRSPRAIRDLPVERSTTRPTWPVDSALCQIDLQYGHSTDRACLVGRGVSVVADSPSWYGPHA